MSKPLNSDLSPSLFYETIIAHITYLQRGIYLKEVM